MSPGFSGRVSPRLPDRLLRCLQMGVRYVLRADAVRLPILACSEVAPQIWTDPAAASSHGRPDRPLPAVPRLRAWNADCAGLCDVQLAARITKSRSTASSPWQPKA